MRRASKATTIAHLKQIGTLQRRLRQSLIAGALALGVMQLSPVAAAAEQFNLNHSLRGGFETSTQAPAIQSTAALQAMAIGSNQLALIRGRGTGAVALAVPSVSGPSIILWDEGLRPVTASNMGTAGNLQSNVMSGGRP